MNIYDNSLAATNLDEKSKEISANVYPERKYISQLNTQRDSDEGHSQESKIFGWNQHELGRKEILEKAPIKPPSYFRLNLS